MHMAMMQVWIVRVPVYEPYMPVLVAMRLSGLIVRAVFMPVMLVMDVPVFVFERIVHMLMFMPLRQMEP